MIFEIPVNKKYIPLIKDRHRFQFIGGGRGSGKSVYGIQKQIIRGIQDRCHRFLILRKTRKSVKESCYKLTKTLLEKYKIQYIENKSDLKIKFWNNEILFIGLDNIEKNLKSIENITSVLIEELTEITYEDMIEINMILRSNLPVYQQIIGLFNPDLQKAKWIKEKYYDKKDKDIKSILNNYKWNSQLNKYYIKELLKLKEQNDALYKIYTLGQWAIPEDIIYTNYDIYDFDHNLEYYNIIGGGIDFGFNSPAAFTLIGTRDQEPYIIDEVYQAGLKLPEFAEMIKECLKENKITKKIDIFCDSEDPGNIAELSGMGLNVYPARKGKNSVFNGIEKLKRIKWHIHNRCINLVKEIQSYSWKKDRVTGQPTDEPVKFLDHALDTVRYFYYTLFFDMNRQTSSISSSGERNF